jgi:hypothetical protein
VSDDELDAAERWADAIRANVRNHVTVYPVADMGELADLLDSLRQAVEQRDTEVDRLRRWKAEASIVLDGWDSVYYALGQPGPIGELRYRAVLHEIQRRLS